ncbi:MAG: 4Fe-4S binding protein [Clostridia bacterium]|nr:4Fe-4S binding protein [Clostridia bacterium]
MKKTKRRGFRLWIQICFSALSNGYLSGFAKGKIWQGPTKVICSPGLNCYSCPGALFSCPVGSLQATLNSRQYHVALYVFGLLTVTGSLLGRAVCGFLCPFGLVQDLLFRLPIFKKRKILPGEKYLRFSRFVILAVLVIILPAAVADSFGIGDPWFCKYFCPAGTLEAGIPLLLSSGALRDSVGILFYVKLAILIFVVVLSVIIFRPFCRYFCPLGALYGLFNRFALYRYVFDEEKCVSCGACREACELSIPLPERVNSVDCIRCGECLKACPTGAIGTVIPFPKKKKEDGEVADTYTGN